MVVDGLLEGVMNESAMILGYADDVALLVRGKNPTTMTKNMQNALGLVQKWCTSQSLKVNPSKTEMVLFTRKRRFDFKAPTLFNTELKFSTEIRYRGVTLDCKLTWKCHIDKQVQKAINIF